MTDEEIKLENERLSRELERDTGLNLDKALTLVTHLRAEADRMVYGLVAVVRNDIRDQAFREAAEACRAIADNPENRDYADGAIEAARAIEALIHNPQNPPS